MTIQLKQPNFAVFYSSFCNISRSSGADRLEQATTDEESLSVREAVKLAKAQNMLGIVLDLRILVRCNCFGPKVNLR
jgi:CDK inhibitor PHO81